MENANFTNTSDAEENNSTLQAKFWDFIKPTYHLQTTRWMRIIFLMRDFLLNFVVGITILMALFLNPLSSKQTSELISFSTKFPLDNVLDYGSSALGLLLLMLCMGVWTFTIGETIRLFASLLRKKISTIEYLFLIRPKGFKAIKERVMNLFLFIMAPMLTILALSIAFPLETFLLCSILLISVFLTVDASP